MTPACACGAALLLCLPTSRPVPPAPAAASGRVPAADAPPARIPPGYTWESGWGDAPGGQSPPPRAAGPDVTAAAGLGGDRPVAGSLLSQPWRIDPPPAPGLPADLPAGAWDACDSTDLGGATPAWPWPEPAEPGPLVRGDVASPLVGGRAEVPTTSLPEPAGALLVAAAALAAVRWLAWRRSGARRIVSDRGPGGPGVALPEPPVIATRSVFPGRRPTALIVDDEPSVLGFVSELLTREGFDTREAQDGRSATALLARGLIDLLVLDVHLSGRSGPEVLREAKRLRPGLPVVVITGSGSIEGATEAVRGGASDYLAKPFGGGELVRAVRRALAEAPRVGGPGRVSTRGGRSGAGRAAASRPCPWCRRWRFKSSRFRWLETLLVLALHRPYRCVSCGLRSWRPLAGLRPRVGG